MFSARQRRRLLIVLVLASVSYLLWVMNREPLPESLPEAFTKGYAATGVSGKISNEQGVYVVHFQARELIQYDQSDSIELDQPNFRVMQEGQPDWHFSARQGQFDRQTQNILFEQDVRAENPGASAGEHILFTTPRLRVDPVHHTAQTRAKIALNGLAVSATAVGAEFDFGNNRHRLLSKVRMQYHDSASTPAP